MFLIEGVWSVYYVKDLGTKSEIKQNEKRRPMMHHIHKTVLIALLGIAIVSCTPWMIKTTETTTETPAPEKPDWPNNPGSLDPIDGSLHHFVGVSRDHATEPDARDDALDHATKQILNFLGVFQEVFIVDVTVTDGMGSEILDPAIKREALSLTTKNGFVAGVAGNRFYIEEFTRADTYGDTRSYYKVYVLVPFSKQDTERVLSVVLRDEGRQALRARADSLSNLGWERLGQRPGN